MTSPIMRHARCSLSVIPTPDRHTATQEFDDSLRRTDGHRKRKGASQVRLGIIAPHIGRSLAVGRLVDACGPAESLGVDASWFGDHIVFPYNYESIYPYGTRDGFNAEDPQELWEALSVMSYVAACTSDILLGTGVLILPYRHPLYTAKTVATIDVLSGGRVLFGAGVGWLEEEFKALDAPSFQERGAVGMNSWRSFGRRGLKLVPSSTECTTTLPRSASHRSQSSVRTLPSSWGVTPAWR